jgi:very-short-patch-repair endonuclease
MTIVHVDELDQLPLPPVSRARLVFAALGFLDAARDELERRASASEGGFRLVEIEYDQPPSLRTLIEGGLDRLAAVALALFPNWYGLGLRFAAADAQTAAFESISIDRLDRLDLLKRGVSPTWLTTARALCRRGALPRPPGFSASVQAAQLAMAIDPAPLLVAFVVDEGAEVDETLLGGLAIGPEWFAREAGARVVAVVPEAFRASPMIERVSFDAVHVRPRGPQEEAAVIPPVKPRDPASPLIGQPNPASRGEMLLAKRLEADAELAGLFQYNVHVPTRRGTSPLVDLVWESGKLVVEVDGSYYHSDASAFSRDRRRDYELLVSGYLVLRLPEDEVADDVEMAVEKIRDLVAFRRERINDET